MMILLLLSGILSNSYAQERQDSLKRKKQVKTAAEVQRERVQYYRRAFGGDSLKAVKVKEVMETYKVEMQKLMANKSVSDAERRERMEALMAKKNEQLRGLLSVTEQRHFIPSTERPEGVGLKKTTPKP
jgi:hypothetical protein